jgi:filamentous hemagglutinin
MNKNLFRIIFNKRRGQLMAVAETSSSQGKAASGEATAMSHTITTVALATLSFAVLCALGAVLWALPAPQAHAQVVAYRQAPGNQQPTILQTANGVPQVNIQTPSAAGVSRNVYSQFDVQNNGVILNNSRTNTATQLGGWVQGNPWLARGSARVILNEVNSSNPSYLNGYVEVAGQKAEVVIANPSGISVNGGGFINASKTTLTTGTPVLSGGNLEGYRVQGGSITVNGHGLDLSTTDYAAILARAVQVNAGIWANELKVVTGANQIDASSLGANTTPVTTAIAGTGAAPSFALDVAQIGGMYAGKIHLIGTEQGLGVRSAGTVGSTGGDLVLQNNGWLMNTGTLQAKGNLHISTQGDIHNSGTIYASNNQTTDATGTVTNSHQIQAGNSLSLSAGHIDNLVTGEILATTNQLKATHTLTNRGLIDGADTQVDGGTVNNIGTGHIYGDHLSIAAATLTNDTETVNGITSAATLAARERLDLGISGTLTNREHALIYSGADMAIGGALDANRQATGQADTVNNNSATIEAGGNLTIASAALNNRNMHLTTELEVKSIEPVVEYQGSGSANRYLAGTTGVYTFTDESLHLHTPEGNHEAWSSYDVTRTISETTIKTSDPSKILAGGNISLFGDTVYNDNSHIIAGNALNANVRTLNNTQLIGDHVVHDTGTATSYWRNKQKGTDSTGSSSANAQATHNKASPRYLMRTKCAKRFKRKPKSRRSLPSKPARR